MGIERSLPQTGNRRSRIHPASTLRSAFKRRLLGYAQTLPGQLAQLYK